MKLLLDTHIFLWYISKDKRLNSNIINAIQNYDNQVFLSVVSIWETIIKYQLKKLYLPEPPQIYLPHQRTKHDISSLELDEKSVVHLASLPPLHRDPFDRILICQTITHDLQLVTMDDIILQYPSLPIYKFK